MSTTRSYLLLLTALMFSCWCSAGVNLDSVPAFKLPYQMDEPDLELELDKELDEISGLSWSPDGRYLVAVQDEKGHIYFINKYDGEIERECDFGPNDDYEGIETVGQEIYVVKSSGTLYRVEQWDGERTDAKKYNDFLNKSFNVEGLAYDHSGNRLLLACKGTGSMDDDDESSGGIGVDRAIYAFDLTTKKVFKKPAYVVNQRIIHDFLQTSPLLRKLEKINAFFAPDRPNFGFSPSGIAIHPLTTDLYILSSVGKLLVVLDCNDGSVKHIEQLDKDVHAQPEGIVFDEDGTLYISNEGRGGTAEIYKFRMRASSIK